MSDVAIKIENVSKQYRLGLVSTGTLSHDLNRWWATKVMRKEDPYLKIGEVNDRTTKGSSDYVWALKDINMEIKQGDVVGIIGKNGAGKSTLLKLLSRVTAPTTGTISYKGRIASLLEVGTGFHPELTGRENIYMNGAIMGMNKAEITRKLDEIVDFSGCERYLDTPVKRYSSGMTVRLGFAIAAHIEPDILVVDEVLAVGDAEFQKKAIGKMQDVSRGEGRTVLFVSHNMAAVRNLCKNGVILENGLLKYSGDVTNAIDKYLSQASNRGINNNSWSEKNAPGNDIIRVKNAYVKVESEYITVKTEFNLITEFWCLQDDIPINISMHLYDTNSLCVFAIVTPVVRLSKGLHKSRIKIPANFMNDGAYVVNNMFVSNSKPIFYHENANSFEVVEDRDGIGWFGKWPGAIRPTFVETELK
ncbi:MAG: ATP-binding cassette domain-containing protein [Bacteroidales bacterium]|nr:ATP-binding cassette domain-containing protein [Bacteroidales bacterium]